MLSDLTDFSVLLVQGRRKRGLRQEPSITPSAQRTVSLANISNVTVMSIEIFACSRGILLPDPLHDAINAVCYAVEAQEGPFESKTKERGVILCVTDEQDADSSKAARFCIDSSAPVVVKIAASERELFEKLMMLVNDWDPDFLTGFEVQKASVGYMVDRANRLDVSSLTHTRLTMCTTTDENVVWLGFRRSI